MISDFINNFRQFLFQHKFLKWLLGIEVIIALLAVSFALGITTARHIVSSNNAKQTIIPHKSQGYYLMSLKTSSNIYSQVLHLSKNKMEVDSTTHQLQNSGSYDASSIDKRWQMDNFRYQVTHFYKDKNNATMWGHYLNPQKKSFWSSILNKHDQVYHLNTKGNTLHITPDTSLNLKKSSIWYTKIPAYEARDIEINDMNNVPTIN